MKKSNFQIIAPFYNDFDNFKLFVEKVENQNLHGELIPDMLIVYHPLFENQVQQLKEFHEGNGLTVLEATVQEIYNEFSGGAQDICAIRDFSKMLNDRSNQFKFLLLFGDGSFDYKNMNTVMRIIKEKSLNIIHQKLEMNCQITLSIRKNEADFIFKIFNNLYEIDIKEV